MGKGELQEISPIFCPWRKGSLTCRQHRMRHTGPRRFSVNQETAPNVTFLQNNGPHCANRIFMGFLSPKFQMQCCSVPFFPLLLTHFNSDEKDGVTKTP